MNLQDLQQQWGNQYSGQGNQNDLVIRLFKESRQSKISHALNKLIFFNILFMLFNLIVIIYSWLVLIENLSNLPIAIPALLMLVLSKIVFYKNVWQLEGLSKINYSEPIIKLQKAIEKLKIRRIKHNRFIFIFCNLYFWLMITLVFQWDLSLLIPAIWVKAPIVVIIHVGMLVIWFPLAFWLLKKYDNVNGDSKFWAKMERESFLTDQSVNFSLNNVLSFLKEIEGFEKEEDNQEKT
ncbi:hypothetical protein QQ008_18580 [Fulvivirgaceae bacterium BMA10]|uniref:2TM domain-containing protein n=1 Tax=Splendidivirga corallicola TaxID=3051826 RepID=A0ABT8KVB0_9BACT|nr:hypothetical protein [Fulvivirgaceae bacterium BMA10]